MAQQPTKVTPDQLGDLGTQLANAGKEVEASLGAANDPVWTAASTFKGYFGPATDVADMYSTMASQLPVYVRAASTRLNHGSQVFNEARSGFADRDQQHSDRMRGAAPK